MRITAFVTKKEKIDKILEQIGEPTNPPEISSARSPPEQEFDFPIYEHD
ncbi:MAG: hypothetical protein ABIH76_03895 [Candidatus Bathyarchaeota archaeon]